MEIKKRFKNVISLVTNSIPTGIVEKLGHDKLAHGFFTAYVVCLFEHFGFFGALLGLALAVGFGYMREKLDAQPDRRDVLWMVAFGAAELLRYVIFG